MPLSLPPLPDFGAPPSSRPAGRDLVVVVSGEHERLVALCAELCDTDVAAQRRHRVGQVVTAMLARHLSAEEQYLYPAVRAAVPDGDRLAGQEVAEDRAVLATLLELAAATPGDADFDRLAGSVAAQVRRHVAAADRELLPLLTQMASVQELIRLGNRFELAREAAPTRPHPATPGTPPWNKVVDPTLGVIDKVRDAVSRRVTYVEDL